MPKNCNQCSRSLNEGIWDGYDRNKEFQEGMCVDCWTRLRRNKSPRSGRTMRTMENAYPHGGGKVRLD